MLITSEDRVSTGKPTVQCNGDNAPPLPGEGREPSMLILKDLSSPGSGLISCDAIHCINLNVQVAFGPLRSHYGNWGLENNAKIADTLAFDIGVSTKLSFVSCLLTT